VIHLVVLASGLRAMTKKGRQLLRKKVHPTKKILTTPMNLLTPGKNPAGAHVYSAVNAVSMTRSCLVTGLTLCNTTL